MSRSYVRCLQVPSASRRFCFASHFQNFALAVLLTVTLSAHAQFSTPLHGTQIHDTSALRPPAGVRVAIVEFVDMECPVCGRENPIVKTAAAKYKIPLVRHDFLIPYHTWSLDAAVYGRWFDANKGKAMGDEYRDEVFANQPTIFNPTVLRQFSERFAQNRRVVLPTLVDPTGKLAAEVKADSDLGRRTGIDHTPTVFIVTANSKGKPFIEVLRPEQELDSVITQALTDTAHATKVITKAPEKPPVKKPAGN